MGLPPFFENAFDKGGASLANDLHVFLENLDTPSVVRLTCFGIFDIDGESVATVAQEVGHP